MSFLEILVVGGVGLMIGAIIGYIIFNYTKIAEWLRMRKLILKYKLPL